MQKCLRWYSPSLVPAPTIETVDEEEEIDGEIDVSQQQLQTVRGRTVGGGQLILDGQHLGGNLAGFMQGASNFSVNINLAPSKHYTTAAAPAAAYPTASDIAAELAPLLAAPPAAADIAKEIAPRLNPMLRQTVQEVGESIAASTMKKPPATNRSVSQADKDTVATSLFATPSRPEAEAGRPQAEDFNVGDIVYTDKDDGPGKIVAKTPKGYRIQFKDDKQGKGQIRYPKTMRKQP